MSMMMLTAGAVHSIHQLGTSLAMFQADKIDSGNAKTLTTFVIIAAVALASQAIAICGIVFVVFKLRAELMSHVGEIKGKIMPLIEKSNALVTDLTPQVKDITAKTNALIGDLSPKVSDITAKVQVLVADLSPKIVGITEKVHAISGHVEEMSGMAKDKVLAFGPTITAANDTVKQTNETVRATIMDANTKTRAQVDRVNGLVTGAIDATVRISKAIEHGITQPAREVSGFVNGAKTTLEHLAKRYGGVVSVEGLSSLFGFGKKKATPSPYTPPGQAVRTPVAPRSPEAMGSSDTRLPSAFGSTKRDMDL